MSLNVTCVYCLHVFKLFLYISNIISIICPKVKKTSALLSHDSFLCFTTFMLQFLKIFFNVHSFRTRNMSEEKKLEFSMNITHLQQHLTKSGFLCYFHLSENHFGANFKTLLTLEILNDKMEITQTVYLVTNYIALTHIFP